MSGKLDINIQQGATYSRIITITDSIGDPINILNSTFSGQVRTSYKADTPSATFAISLYTNGADGKILAELTAIQTSDIPSGKCVYDIEWTDNDTNVVRRLLEGVAVVSQEVTR